MDKAAPGFAVRATGLEELCKMWSHLFVVENIFFLASAAICIGIVAYGIHIISRYRIQKKQTGEFVHKYGFVKTQTDDNFLTGVLARMYWRLSFVDAIPGKMDYKIFTAYKVQFDGEDVYMFDASSKRKVMTTGTAGGLHKALKGH
ncbi:hypothetical protein ACFL0Q_05840, partial [Thermodesulfobacteriota bacterium]